MTIAQTIFFSVPTIAKSGTIDAKSLPDGTPVKRFTHQAFKVGETYKKVMKNGDIEELHGDEERVGNWLATIEKRIAKGVAIPAIDMHGKRADSRHAMGEIVDAAITDGWLTITNEIRGAENIRVAEANRVSIEIEPPGKITDGSAEIYPECIGAVAYTPVPVVYGTRFAAALEDGAAFELGESTMDLPKHFKAIEKMNGLPKGSVNEENATDHIAMHAEQCNGTKGRYMSLEAIGENETLTAGLKAEVAALKAKLAESKTKTLSLETKPDTKYLYLSARTKESLIAAAVPVSVTKATADKLREKFIGKVDAEIKEFSTLTLSLNSDEGDGSVDLLEWTLKLIKDNKAGITEPKHLALVAQETANEQSGPATFTPGSSGWAKSGIVQVKQA